MIWSRRAAEDAEEEMVPSCEPGAGLAPRESESGRERGCH
jgi:hypothetical protein